MSNIYTGSQKKINNNLSLISDVLISDSYEIARVVYRYANRLFLNSLEYKNSAI